MSHFLPRAVFFDLDGTLLDTADDLGAALNRVMDDLDRPRIAAADYRPIASNGSTGLLSLGLGCEPNDPKIDLYRQDFLDYYHADIATHTRPYDGVMELIAFLQSHNIGWGIITNKPEGLTHRLLTELNLFTDSPVIIGGDTFTERKPSPLPLIEAAKLINVTRDHCWYIGDAPRDIASANAANMYSVIAGWGYVEAYDCVSTWRADTVFSSVNELIDVLSELHQTVSNPS